MPLDDEYRELNEVSWHNELKTGHANEVESIDLDSSLCYTGIYTNAVLSKVWNRDMLQNTQGPVHYKIGHCKLCTRDPFE